LTWKLCRDLQGARSAAMFEEEAPPPVGPAEVPVGDTGSASSFSKPEPTGGSEHRGRRE